MKKAERIALYGTGKDYWRRLWSDIRGSYWLYLLMIPGIIYFIVFKYLPMWGVVIIKMTSYQNPKVSLI